MCTEKVLRILTNLNWEFLQKLKGKAYKNCIRGCLIYGSETWQKEVKQEVKLEKNEMSMIRWTCGFTVNERQNAEVSELQEPVSLVIKKADEYDLYTFNMKMMLTASSGV